jgi:transcriptional regulator with XRE-family HTH domain
MKKTIYTARHELLRRALVAMREGAGLNQRQLARKLHRENSFVSRIEVGQRRVDLVEFYSLCEACGANPVKAASRLMRQFKRLADPPASD